MPVLDEGRYRAGLAARRPDRQALFTDITDHTVTWAEGTAEHVDTIMLATGYRPDVGYPMSGPQPLVISVVSLPMRAEALKGHLDGLLLAVLESAPAHGYAIMEAIRDGSGATFDLPTGTVYPALHRLERAGLIRGSWADGPGRRRRVYELTTAGRRALAEQRDGWQRFSDAVTAVLHGAGRTWPASA